MDQSFHLPRGPGGKPAYAESMGKKKRMKRSLYDAELFTLQAELVKLQEWVKATGQRLVIIFEGRDAAGKGSTIKRVTQYLNPPASPRSWHCPPPTERQKSQWYFQRYISHLPPPARSCCSTAPGTTGRGGWRR